MSVVIYGLYFFIPVWSRNVSCALLCFSGLLIGPYKLNLAQVNNYPNYISSPSKVESVTKNASKKREKGSNCNLAFNVFCTESINTPKLPNSRVQLPMGIYRSGCLSISSMAYATYSNSLQINLYQSQLEKVPIRWNNRVGWWRNPISRYLYITGQTSEFDARLWSWKGTSEASKSA